MRKKKIDAFPYLMCLAAVVLFTLFVVLPFAVGVYTSFFKWDGFSDMKFNGLKNYLYVFQDDIYWKAIKNTFVYAIDRKSTRLNSSHLARSRMPSSA